jgi:ectoine hydroxylase-related dioxygenase (phytanoyl-CoA dioxygenase family)
MLDAVESVLGPDLMVWGCEFFIKEPMSPKFVSWHQDLTYWGLSDAGEVTAWVALSAATVENGAMRMVPGSQRSGIVPHRDTFAEDNILSRGQEITDGVDESRAVDVVLRPGEMSLHHGRMFHASGPNRTAGRRIALVVRYIAPAMRQTRGERDFAVLVRGEDRFGHFVNPPLPTAEFAPEAVAMVMRMDEDQTAYLYEGAARKGHRDALRAGR